MTELNHMFKLELPNGVKVQVEGDGDFVNHLLVHTEMGIDTHDRATPKLVQSTISDETDKNKRPSTNSPIEKVKIDRKRNNSSNGEAKEERKKLLSKIKETAEFHDSDRYTASIQSAKGPLDRAALISRMVQEKFGLDSGLTPAEIRMLLSDRFLVGQDARSLELAMQGASTSFFLKMPAPFDGRAKLYKPMTDCIKRVADLLNQQPKIVVTERDP